ncbi:MAG: DUF4124 domain-containing protein [Pseudomonadota bacterium]
MTSQQMAVSLALALACISGAQAQTHYKCQNSSGKVEFSDTPCSADLSHGKVRARANSLDSSGNRELILRQENERLKEQLNEREKAAAPSAPQRTQADLQAERIDQLACERARRDYEVTASSKFNSPEIIEAKRSMMYGTCGMQEPSRTNTTINNRILVR